MVGNTSARPGDPRLTATFVEGTDGALFQVLYEPAAVPLRGIVLFVQPLAEEMNKSRRMAALQARVLAARGFVVLMPDLYGCGDSGGDFANARWETWVADLRRARDQLFAQFGGPLVLWGLRAGCLLLDELGADGAGAPTATVLWQPVTNGELHLTQFLRLRMAAGMMGGAKETTGQLRARLEGGEVLEVAGYGLAPELAARLAAARLNPLAGGPVCWLEVAQAENPQLSPASARLVDAWRQDGVALHAAAVQGEPFWTTQEIREAPALLDATLRWLDEVMA